VERQGLWQEVERCTVCVAYHAVKCPLRTGEWRTSGSGGGGLTQASVSLWQSFSCSFSSSMPAVCSSSATSMWLLPIHLQQTGKGEEVHGVPKSSGQEQQCAGLDCLRQCTAPASHAAAVFRKVLLERVCQGRVTGAESYEQVGEQGEGAHVLACPLDGSTLEAQFPSKSYSVNCTHTQKEASQEKKHRGQGAEAALPSCSTSLLLYFPTAGLPYCRTSLLQGFPTAVLPYCRASLLQGFPTAGLPYCRASLLQGFPTAVLPYPSEDRTDEMQRLDAYCKGHRWGDRGEWPCRGAP